MNFDIFLVGVGGQGILTIGEILASTAEHLEIPVNFFPSKGMAQRGGFVKAQLRLGRDNPGPNIPERSADLVFAMEQSEALKAIRYVRPGSDFILYGDVWSPAAVMLGKASYPAIEQVRTAVLQAGARFLFIPPTSLPTFHREPVAPNIFMLGVALAHTSLGQVFTAEQVAHSILERWQRAGESNRFAFQAGLASLPHIQAAEEVSR
ncbi:MAG: 2-oxoacid:acceptor oxidoreductase family protein [Anaerolineaceae bacterium]|nr:2-oxoacid:acceptor oxidoreductase family protein [Anaerolineaceae bacterium]